MSRAQTSDFNYDMQYLIDMVTDYEILFKTGIDLNERVQHIDNSILTRENIIYAEFNYYKKLVVFDWTYRREILDIIEYDIARVLRDGSHTKFTTIMLDIIQVIISNKIINTYFLH